MQDLRDRFRTQSPPRDAAAVRSEQRSCASDHEDKRRAVERRSDRFLFWARQEFSEVARLPPDRKNAARKEIWQRVRAHIEKCSRERFRQQFREGRLPRAHPKLHTIESVTVGDKCLENQEEALAAIHAHFVEKWGSKDEEKMSDQRAWVSQFSPAEMLFPSDELLDAVTSLKTPLHRKGDGLAPVVWAFALTAAPELVSKAISDAVQSELVAQQFPVHVRTYGKTGSRPTVRDIRAIPLAGCGGRVTSCFRDASTLSWRTAFPVPRSFSSAPFQGSLQLTSSRRVYLSLRSLWTTSVVGPSLAVISRRTTIMCQFCKVSNTYVIWTSRLLWLGPSFCIGCTRLCSSVLAPTSRRSRTGPQDP